MRKFLIILLIAFIVCSEVVEISDAEKTITNKNSKKEAKEWLIKAGVYNEVVLMYKAVGIHPSIAHCKKITKSDLCDIYIKILFFK